MARQPAKKEDPPDRRSAILQAALACFNDSGIEAAVIGDICKAAGASIGSVYHHFGSKEGIAVELLAEGLKGNALQLEQRLLKVRGPRQGIYTMVESLIDWIVAHPDWARFIYTVSSSGLGRSGSESLRETNEHHTEMLRSYFGPHIEAGAFRRLPPDAWPSLVLGPTHDYARRWLNGQATEHISAHKDLFSGAAWNAVRAG